MMNVTQHMQPKYKSLSCDTFAVRGYEWNIIKNKGVTLAS